MVGDDMLSVTQRFKNVVEMLFVITGMINAHV